MSTRTRTLGLLAALVGAVALFTVRPVEDSDTFWHLATGRLISEQGVPSVNTFSSTNPEYPWQTTEWLFDVAIFQVFRSTGFNGLIALDGFIVLLTLLALAGLVKRLTGQLTWWHFLAFAYWLHFSRFRLVSRPQLVTFLCLALLLNLWFRRKTPGVLVAIPLLALVWANMHAGVVLGSVAALLLFAGTAATALQPSAPAEARMELREALIFVLLFVPATLLNQSLAYPYIYTFGHLSVGDILPIYEFERTTFRSRESFFVFAAFLFLSLPSLPRRFLGPAVSVCVPFFVLALMRVRIIPKFGVIALPFFCLAFETVQKRILRGCAKWAAGPVLAGLLVALSVRDLADLPPGLGMGTRGVPVGGAQFLKENLAAENLYNDFDDGGYLIFALYPGRRVFQDGRIPYYPAGFFTEVLSTKDSHAWGLLMDKYRVNTAIVKRRPGGIDYSGFFSSLHWPLVYLDGNSYIFVRDIDLNRKVIERFAFEVLVPHMSEDLLRSALRESPEALRRDLLRLDPVLLADSMEFVNYGYTLYRLGQPTEAHRFLEEGQKRFPRVEEFDIVKAQLLRDEGRRLEAIRCLQSVVERTAKPQLKEFAVRMLGTLQAPHLNPSREK